MAIPRSWVTLGAAGISGLGRSARLAALLTGWPCGEHASLPIGPPGGGTASGWLDPLALPFLLLVFVAAIPLRNIRPTPEQDLALAGDGRVLLAAIGLTFARGGCLHAGAGVAVRGWFPAGSWYCCRSRPDGDQAGQLPIPRTSYLLLGHSAAVCLSFAARAQRHRRCAGPRLQRPPVRPAPR